MSWGKQDPVFPSLPNLKCLELRFDDYYNKCALLHLAFFIRQTPRLHTLVLKFESLGSQKRPFAKKRAARCSHDCLKVVKLAGYCGLSRHIELVKYLMKTASNLEKIIFDPVCNYKLQHPSDISSSAAAARQLKEKLPATLEVVCV